MEAQQVKAFVEEVNLETLAFLDVWSLVVYVAVAGASYVVAARLVAESGYELSVLRALGAGGGRVLALVVAYVGVVALAGSALGVSLGLAGAQMASTVLMWLRGSVQVFPVLEPLAALRIVLLALASAFAGGLYPAYRASRTVYAEKML